MNQTAVKKQNAFSVAAATPGNRTAAGTTTGVGNNGGGGVRLDAAHFGGGVRPAFTLAAYVTVVTHTALFNTSELTGRMS